VTSSPGLEELADRLDAIAEELADLALDRLRTALADQGAAAAGAEERRLTKARRRISEAATILRDG
jgi:ABC-type transport system involved in cytochrome bd biosynthesis fused ATPase/permease subunit